MFPIATDITKLSESALMERRLFFEGKRNKASSRLEFDDVEACNEEIMNIDRAIKYKRELLQAKVKTKKPCVCGKPVNARGLCSTHHKHFKRTGKIPVLVNGGIELIEGVPAYATVVRPRFSLLEYVT